MEANVDHLSAFPHPNSWLNYPSNTLRSHLAILLITFTFQFSSNGD